VPTQARCKVQEMTHPSGDCVVYTAIFRLFKNERFSRAAYGSNLVLNDIKSYSETTEMLKQACSKVMKQTQLANGTNGLKTAEIRLKIARIHQKDEHVETVRSHPFNSTTVVSTRRKSNFENLV